MEALQARDIKADPAIYPHIPVMVEDVVRLLSPQPGDIILDATVGSGGHAQALLSAAGPGALLIGIDRDPVALERAQRQLHPFGASVRLQKANYADLDQVLDGMGIPEVTAVLFDLGVSSPQLDDPERGFTYRLDAPLDMRMDPEQKISAYHLVNGLSEKELARILKEYGEERWAARIASFIVEARKKEPIATTGQLVDLIKGAIPKGARLKGPHPARRTFQALRIAVNRELESLEMGLERAFARLAPGGRMAVLSFHSLEDRIVKQRFRRWAKGCSCPPDAPLCTCEGRPRARLLTKGALLPAPEETQWNPRARSARLRALLKLGSSLEGGPVS
ncbi:MAG: 16S rRNA (cytosine(1402)-N(4))-methyltransferase RsmH [Bacillota bacterium]|nr:16S rRNA (cytosine(1402)-N(4))-methyltransferase RsmH [Bacillota bacterium]